MRAADVVVDAFEYSGTDELVTYWTGSGNAVLTASDVVAPGSSGKMSLSMEFQFASQAWATAFAKGTDLAEPVAIGPNQFVSFRVKGDPAFLGADFRSLYLYAYDDAGNFGRWGAPVPVSSGWQVRNHPAGAIEKPWDSPALPDLSRIVRFAFFQYGSEAALPDYAATVHVDDLSVRDAELIEAPQGPDRLSEPFEYATAAELTAFWKGSANAVLSLSDAVAPRSSGRSALRATFNFPSTEWATESVQGPRLAAPIRIESNQYVSFRVKGDPAFAGADFRQLYLYLYDADGNFGRWGAEVPVTAAWQIRNHSADTLEKPWDSPALPDLTRIVRAALFQYGSQTAVPAYTASIEIDDLDIRNTPLVEETLPEEVVIDAFEYASSDELAAAWQPGGGNVALEMADTVSSRTKGKAALRIGFNFGSSEWATESVRGLELAKPIALDRSQYVSFRIFGDPAFATSDFHNLFLYAYDSAGRFGRWGAPTPVTAEWGLLNFSVAGMEKPWDSPELPDLSDIVRFSFFQYGSQAAIEAYAATVLIDDLTVRTSPLKEFPPAAAPRTVIDDFESYSGTPALLAAYSYVTSPATTVATASLASPAPQGSKALRLAVDFAAGQYPWGSVRSAAVVPFSLPTNAVVSFRIQGDPGLAATADAGTSFWLSFYDQSGQPIHYVTSAAVVTNAGWTTVEAPFQDFRNTAAVDTGNLVGWRILVQGWEGTSTSPVLSGAVQVDDIRVGVASVPPTLGVVREGSRVSLRLGQLTAGAIYEVRTSTDLRQWSTAATLQPTEATATWATDASQPAAFFQVIRK